MAVRFLLDTNICIYIAKRHPPEVAIRFENLQPGDVGMSIITYGERLFGAEKSQHLQPAKGNRCRSQTVWTVEVNGVEYGSCSRHYKNFTPHER